MSKSKKNKKKSRQSKKDNKNTLQIVQVDKEYLENLKEKEVKEEVNKENNNINDDYTENLYNKTKKYNFIEPIIVILSLIICFFLLYKFIIVSKRTVVNTLFNNVTNNMIRFLDDISKIDYTNNSFDSDIELSFSTTNDYLKQFTNYKYLLTNQYDANNKILSGTLDVKTLNNQSITNLNYKYINNNLYLSNPDIFYFPVNIVLNNYISDNIDYQLLKDNLINIKNIIVDNLTYKNVTRKDDKIIVDSDEIEVNNLELYYDNMEFNKVVNNILDDIESDENLVNNLSKLCNITTEELQEYFSNLRNINREIKINIYTKGLFAEVIGFKLTIDNVEILSMYNHNSKDIYTGLYDNESIELIVDKTYNNFILNYADVPIIEISNFNSNEKELSFDYNVNTILDKWVGSIKIEKITDNKSNINISFINAENRDINGDLTLNIETKPFTNNLNIDINDSININDLSIEDYLTIWSNFLEKLKEPVIIN